ncbi:MAG TPA: S49 family peptidase [Alcaligenes phenolicus]|uniref:S49 family peptidase n=1 Tax=Alcaligenes phenolicus TaxID=232846 RepID=UPI002B8FAD56|nr:S49 family peptidase [Alcaligenes phenolicus]HRO22591.1 S49 family peptidase [Alcaligenes phenolicus]
MFNRKSTSTYSESDLVQFKVKTEKSGLRWNYFKRTCFGLILALGVAGSVTKLIPYESDKAKIPVVRLEGGIAGDASKGSADFIIQKLKIAFDMKNAEGVILYIDSPGGSPAEAERINRFIERKKAETKKPLYAVCGNMCASAGYMIAAHADEIYAGKYSLVGSIGAILSSWNFSEAIEKFGIQHNAYASGKLKAMLNPFAPYKQDDAVKAQTLVNGMGKIFASEVQERRGQKLSTDIDLFTGEVWDGKDAKTYGLIDAVGTLDDVANDKFADNAVVVEINKAGKGLQLLQSATNMAAQSIVSAMVEANTFKLR